MELIREIYASLKLGKDLVVATIISDSGSTPRGAGSKMAVYEDSTISGTIGGGAVEGDVIKSALDLFVTKGAMISSYDLTDKGSTEGMDLICGGKIKVLLEYTAPQSDAQEIYGAAAAEIEKSQTFFLVTRISGNNDLFQVQRGLQTEGRWVGHLQLQQESRLILESSDWRGGEISLMETGEVSYVVERFAPADIIFLVGGGHVSKEIAALADMVGFNTIVFDDREDFANPQRFPTAAEVYVCPAFQNVFEDFTIGEAGSIVIVTRGHQYDRDVLAQALRTQAGYIGMIGSSRKKAGVYKSLIAEGVDPGELEKVHCPIGLSIEAETPAEIAVSVMAQLIQHRARRKSHD